MRTGASYLGILLLSASVLFGQKSPSEPAVDRSFHLDNTPSARGLQEMLTMLRTVGNIRHISPDAPQSTITMTGTPGDIAMAGWLIREMDQPVTGEASQRQTRETSVHEYRVPEAKDDIVRMFYLSHLSTPQSVQELLTVLRTVGQVQQVFNYSALEAIGVRGTPDKLDWVAWTIHELDQEPGAQTAGTHEFRSSDRSIPVSRVFYLVHHRSTTDLQETLTALRTKILIRYAFNFSSLSALVVGGTPDEIEQAARLIDDKDRPVASR